MEYFVHFSKKFAYRRILHQKLLNKSHVHSGLSIATPKLPNGNNNSTYSLRFHAIKSYDWSNNGQNGPLFPLLSLAFYNS